MKRLEITVTPDMVFDPKGEEWRVVVQKLKADHRRELDLVRGALALLQTYVLKLEKVTEDITLK